MNTLLGSFRKNRVLWITLIVFFLLFFIAIRGMEPRDWVITLLRGLSVGSVIFLVASGFSLIFGLMDVLNLAHGSMFMIGAYVGWTVAVRPDTAVDAFTPLILLISGFVLLPLWDRVLRRIKLPSGLARLWPWVGLILTLLVLAETLPKYPITYWDIGSYEISPTNYAFAASQGELFAPEPVQFSGISPVLGLGGIILGSLLAGLCVAGFAQSRRFSASGSATASDKRMSWNPLIIFTLLVILGIGVYLTNTPISDFLLSIDNTWLFLLAILVAVLTGVGVGLLTETTLIRPLYATPVYILMLTLGISAIVVEVVRSTWGSPEFTMPRASIFNGTGEGCPAESIGALFANQCSTIRIFEGRVRTYNEVFIPLLGLVVLVAVWFLLQRTRLGMIVRAGVQDSEMVEALGINVRRVFTTVFAMGVGLAALGGVVAAPSMGLTTTLGESLLINILVALAIGGLTSYPGAAVGSLMVGLLQQFIIKYGQIGIKIPFLAEPFKPTPPLVPASTVLLMVVILLLMPQGLFGRKE